MTGQNETPRKGTHLAKSERENYVKSSLALPCSLPYHRRLNDQ